MYLNFDFFCTISVYKNQQYDEQPKERKYIKSTSHITVADSFQYPVIPIFHIKSNTFAAAASNTETTNVLFFTEVSNPETDDRMAMITIITMQRIFISE